MSARRAAARVTSDAKPNHQNIAYLCPEQAASPPKTSDIFGAERGTQCPLAQLRCARKAHRLRLRRG